MLTSKTREEKEVGEVKLFILIIVMNRQQLLLEHLPGGN